MISNIYAQCDDYGQSQCNNDNNCEWIENIEIEYCEGDSAGECLTEDECSWDLTYGGYLSFEWYYSCNGYYEIDNSYCHENEISECLEMSELECDNNNCEWIENIETEWCSGNNQAECFAQEECYWYSGGIYLGSQCTGGSYEVDNSYCQENEIPECSDMNESECSYENICEWVENIELVSCNDINSQQECSALGCSWYNGNYYACSICCWGEYEVDNSYCEETEYQLGDLNQDFIINIQDIIIVINLILNGEFDLGADLNLDNTVNVLDVIQLVNIILNN